MSIIGFQFNKILIEKYSPVQGKISVNNNVALTNVEKSELVFGNEKQNILRFDFEFNASYEPKGGKKVASIILHGGLTYLDQPAKIAELEKGWKKDKKIPREVMTPILNSILSKCNIEALVLAKEINLPPPIPMPKVNVK